MKKIKMALAFLILVPVIAYAILVGLIKYDEFTSKISKNDIPALVKTSTQSHKLVLISSGLASLWKRVQLIQQAEKSIELEYFIYDLDLSSRLITQELIKKAAQGVKVRVIVDFSLPVFKLNPFVAAFLKKSGIEVKYYNTSSLMNIWSTQHRSHRKLLIVDGKTVITGGRNIADDYFDISEHYNFFDTDVLIQGEIVKSVLESFNVYWNSELALSAENLTTDFSDRQMEASLNFVRYEPKTEKLLADLDIKGRELYEKSVHTDCKDITFATDHPGTSVAKRVVYDVLVKESDKAVHNIWIESPYFVVQNDGLEHLKKLTSRNISINVLTNSLHSTDAYYTVSAMSSNIKNLYFSGMEIWAYSGKARSSTELINGHISSVRWGLHSKRGVIDDKTSLIGTYNIDPRSANLNSELVVICRNNPVLAQAIKSDMKNRMENSFPIVKSGCIECSKNLIKDADYLSVLKFLIFLPLANQLQFLL